MARRPLITGHGATQKQLAAAVKKRAPKTEFRKLTKRVEKLESFRVTAFIQNHDERIAALEQALKALQS